MRTNIDKKQENKNQPIKDTISQKKSVSNSKFQFIDNRPESVMQMKLQEITNNNPQHPIQLKINADKVRNSKVWKDLKDDDQGKSIIKDITKQRNTAYIDNSPTGPFYAEPITRATRGKLVGDVNVQIPINDRLEAKRKKTGYRLEDGNEQEQNRATTIAYHELGHALHLLKNESPSMDNLVYHEVLRGGVQIVDELIPLEEILNVGFKDNPGKNIEHKYYEMDGTYRINHRRGDDITNEINERIGNRSHKENDFRETHGKDIRVGYNLPPQ
ncbi:hypothetical protein [Aureivirga marina]|uniref:hypothetical protein n=1 Tax=Aureivirga marina TaxID=1182451 RepID=UPI0018C91EEC|nr:hypothetical protein [Aureivirga marina]